VIVNLQGLCGICIHRRSEETRFTCAAFPQGIPEKFLTGRAEHTQPEPGDGGIQFQSGLGNVRSPESLLEL
jgi:hypothetical protein